MPLLRKQPFHKVKPPQGLRPDDEVFHCSITNEIFKTYEEFFERTILCNSLVWSCTITGRSGLTYAEALESERAAEKRLATFDFALQKPLLYLVTLTQKSRFMDLCEDVFQFAIDRYFIGESVDVIIGRQPMPAVILRVQAPPRTVPSKTNGEVIVIDEDSEPEEEEREVPPACEMMYVVALSSNPSKRVMVKAIQISRKKGSYNRERNKLFLKHKCHSANGMWRVKDSVRNRMQLAGTKFEELFAGPRPKFAVSEKRRYSTSVSASSSAGPRPTSSTSSMGSSYHSNQSAGGSHDKMLAAKKQMQKHQERRERNSPQNTVSIAELQQMKQQERLEKLTKQLAMKKKFEEERQRLKEEKERQREEREKERQKKLEEKKKKMEELREWNRPREDMECDDLKPLPEFKELKTRVPAHLCGDALMVLEYVNAFKSMFDFDQFFPNGFSWDVVESAVIEADQQGPLCDLLQMLLCTVFNLQETEAGDMQAQGTEGMVVPEEPDKKPSASHAGDEENGEDDDQVSNNELIRSATVTAQFSMLTFGVPLKDTTLDQYTLTEIMRLHLASSGADANQNNARFRYQQRGGYSALDDPGLELRKHEPALIKKLQTGNVFDLGPDEKLKLVTTLVQQVMSYAAVRDVVEDAYDKLRVKKYDLKILQWSEARRVRDVLGANYRREMEERVKEQEYRLQEMARDAQIRKAIDSGLPPPVFPPLEDTRLTAEQKQQRKEQEEEEDRKKKEDYIRRDLETQKEIMELQQTNAIYPLGRDRLYRRYWYFSSLPAMLVEDHELFLPFDPAVGESCLPVAQPADEACDVPGGEGKGQVNGEVKREESPAVNGDSSEGGASVSGGKVKAEVEQTEQSCEGQKDGLTDKAHAEQEVKNGHVTNAEQTDTSHSKQTERPHDKTHGDSTADAKEAGKTQTDASDSKQTERSQARGVTAVADQMDVSHKEPRWYVVDSKQCLDQLMSTLNPRGFRESALHAVLLDFQRLLHRTMQSCPVDKLHQASHSSSTPAEDRPAGGKASTPSSSTPISRRVVGSTKSDAVSEILELTLRDGLLDIEGRIYAGGLGALRVKDRTAWRAALENGGYSPLTDEAPFARVHSPKKAKAAKRAHIPEEVVSRDLAHALVQIARGVDIRYLKPPYECQRRTVLDRWEESSLASSSLSQVFLHLAAFDKSVKWNRSTLKMRCRVCRRMRDDDKMLLCDKCDRGHHIYCLKPPLTKIPSGDWFCFTCRPKTSAPAPRKRRQNFDEEEEEVESEGCENSVEEASDAEEGEEAEESEDTDEIPNEDVCAECREDGVLILCDVCPRSFHLDCAQPPLKKVPKGKWMCHVCVGAEQPGKSKGKGGKHNSSKKGSPYTPISGSSKSKHSGSSRQQTPRSSPTPTSGRRKPGSGHSQKSNGATGKQQNTDKSTPKGWTNGEGQRKRKASSLFPLTDADDQDSEGRTPGEQMQAAETVLKDVMEHEDAWPFLKPVDKKVAPDYYEVIESPMDLATIRSKVRHQGYASPGMLFGDVRLIFTNCVKYNLSSAPVYQAGQALSKYFQARVGALGFQALEKSSPSLQSSPAAAKKQRR